MEAKTKSGTFLAESCGRASNAPGVIVTAAGSAAVIQLPPPLLLLPPISFAWALICQFRFNNLKEQNGKRRRQKKWYFWVVGAVGGGAVGVRGPTTTFGQKSTSFFFCFHSIQNPSKRVNTHTKKFIWVYPLPPRPTNPTHVF